MTATDSPPPTRSTNGGPNARIRHRVAESGVKGGIVDLDTGSWIGERFKLETRNRPLRRRSARPWLPFVREFGWTEKVGVTYPGVVTDGIVRTAANVDKGWIGCNASEFYGKALGGQPVTVLNDADAAGLAEEKFGAGKGQLRRHRAVDVRHRHRLGGDPQRRVAAQYEFGHIEVPGQDSTAFSDKSTKT